MAVEIKGLDSLMRKLDRMGGNVLTRLKRQQNKHHWRHRLTRGTTRLLTRAI